MDIHPINKYPYKPVLGIIHNTSGIGRFVSVSKIWEETICQLSKNFSVNVYKVTGFEIDSKSPSYRHFLDKVDVLVSLAPYYTIDRTVKEIPTIVFALGSIQKGGHWLYRNRKSFRAYDSLIVNCQACMEIFRKLVGDTAMKCYIVPFPVDTEAFYQKKGKFTLRRKYGIPIKCFTLIYSGRISIQKNCHLLLSVLREIRKKINAHLVVVGFFDDFYIPEFSEKEPPNSKSEFLRMVDEFGLANCTTVVPHQTDPLVLAEILSMCDVGINLSTLINENFGLSQVEMQACGIPVVCTDWGGMKDTVIHDVTGFRVDTVLTDCGPRLDFDQVLYYLEALAVDASLRKNMGSRASLHAQKYRFPAYLERISKVIYETLSRFNPADDHNSFVFDLRFERIYRVLSKERGETVPVIWEHLHPSRDLTHYKMIVSSCTTREANQCSWESFDRISKGFDWTIENDLTFISHDPRWDLTFELFQCVLSEDDLKIMLHIDRGCKSGSELEAFFPWSTIQEGLIRLARKGFIIQSQSSHLGPAKIDEQPEASSTRKM